MLDQLLPRVHRRYTSLPVLGPRLGDFARWLLQQGYPRHRARLQIRSTRRIEEALHDRGVNTLSELTREQLRACAPLHSWDAPDLVGTVHSLGRYLDAQGLLPPRDPPGRTETLVNSYEAHLHDVRGLAHSTVAHHRFTVGQFLQQLGYEENPSRLSTLAATDIERFIRTMGPRLSRATLQHVVAQLRGFLRFLAMCGAVVPGLDAQIDTPRLYRGEQLPRSLPWETVRALLMSIDRTSRCGLRDYTIFLLIVTYGLRASEVVSLTLDDVEWRAGRIRVPQRKTRGPLLLPLTDEVGACLIQYLRQARPALPCRELFLRARAPAGVLKPTAITEAFQKWSRGSGLNISFQGPHCLRHSYAVNLLRKGTSLKTIGDILGHRTAESTCVYLRLAVEDLRGEALPLPNVPILDAGRGGKAMNDKELFASVLGRTIAEYVSLKQALGRGYDGERRILASLDAFLATQDSDLATDTFTRWCHTQEHLTSGVRRHRMRVVRNLTLYRRRREPSCFVPDPLLFPPPHQPVQPYIFTQPEIAGLIQQADALAASRDCPLRPELFSLAITLLYTAGLRRGELLRMTIGDYDAREGTLLVRKSKFHKSRILPLSSDGIERLDRYLHARRARRLPVSPEIPLMWHARGGGRAYTAVGLGDVVHRLFDAVGVRKPDGHRPRIHDFRHSFAVHALLRWYHAGEDVQAKLPLLATYMGHVSIVSTQYYLKLTESLASSASERFANRCASLISPLPIPGDAQ